MRDNTEILWKVKKNSFIVSRASTAIYLILKTNGFAGKKVMVPANICYAAIYPIIYAGAEPVFVDVCARTGNVTVDTVKAVIDDVDAVLVAHMYGNPIQDMAEIANICKDNHKLLIEDCASAMGATINGRECGSFGDYSIFSTGYSKTVDFGGGGIVFSDVDLASIKGEYELLPSVSPDAEINNSFFTKMYRLIRNNEDQTLDRFIWKGLEKNLKYLYIFKDPAFDEKIANIASALEESIENRLANYKYYSQAIDNKDIIYRFYEGSVPWRFNIMVPASIRRTVVEKLLEQNIPVSDWYPVVTPIFSVDKERFTGALEMEKAY